MAETSRDSTIFDAPVLMDGNLSCGQNMLKTSEGSLESGMTDNGLVSGGDVDTHLRQEDRVEGSGGGGKEGATIVMRKLVKKGWQNE